MKDMNIRRRLRCQGEQRYMKVVFLSISFKEKITARRVFEVDDYNPYLKILNDLLPRYQVYLHAHVLTAVTNNCPYLPIILSSKAMVFSRYCS